MIGSY